MMDKEPVVAYPNPLEVDDGLDAIVITNRDRACLVLPDLDYEAQLIAIKELLRRNEQADVRTSEEIQALDAFARKSTGLRNDRAVDEWLNLLHGSTYQSAANSMAAVGMLAPLIESLFYQAFQGIRATFYGADVIPSGYGRSGMRTTNDFWDCHLIFAPTRNDRKAKNLVLGIMELAEAINLTMHLPSDLGVLLSALIRYRNKMFHSGFEWPASNCVSFAAEITSAGWGDWFTSATRVDIPFVFYMTDAFVARLLALVDEVLNSFGAYCTAKLEAGATGGPIMAQGD